MGNKPVLPVNVQHVSKTFETKASQKIGGCISLKTQITKTSIPLLGATPDSKEFCSKDLCSKELCKDVQDTWSDTTPFDPTVFDASSRTVLGQGRFGRVTKERLQGTNEWVIVKRISKAKPEGIREGEKELYLLRHIRPKCSPYFLCVQRHQEDADYDYLWFPYEPAFEPWGTVIAQGASRFFESDVAFNNALRHLLKGLGHMHRLGVAHRDIKPANILVHRNGAIRYIDFGSSCLKVTTCNAIRCQDMIVVGTPLYSPPEFDWRSINATTRYSFDDYAKADLWALGLLILDIFFPSEGAFQTWRHTNGVSESFESLKEFQSTLVVPTHIESELQKRVPGFSLSLLLQRDPKQRSL